MLWLSLLVLLDCFFLWTVVPVRCCQVTTCSALLTNFIFAPARCLLMCLGAASPSHFFFSKKIVSEHLVTTEEHATSSYFPGRSVRSQPADCQLLNSVRTHRATGRLLGFLIHSPHTSSNRLTCCLTLMSAIKNAALCSSLDTPGSCDNVRAFSRSR